jgi:hypothetical protein
MNMNKLLGISAIQVCNCPEDSVAHLAIWKPAVIIFDLGGSACRWHLDHLSFELYNGTSNMPVRCTGIITRCIVKFDSNVTF